MYREGATHTWIYLENSYSSWSFTIILAKLNNYLIFLNLEKAKACGAFKFAKGRDKAALNPASKKEHYRK